MLGMSQSPKVRVIRTGMACFVAAYFLAANQFAIVK
jgi:hypothetical protein